MGKISAGSVIGITFMIAGILTFLSPDIMQICQNAETAIAVRKFEAQHNEINQQPEVQEVADTQIETDDEAQKEEVSEMYRYNFKENKTEDPLYQQMATYNRELYEDGQKAFSDPWFYEEPQVDMKGLEDDIFGYISIPDMGKYLIVSLGATKENMAESVAVMGGTSIPIGGINTNAVIAGHRGYNRIKTFFKDIEDIKIGSYIFLKNQWETLTYRVIATEVIEPDDVDAVKIQDGRDMLTLLTCHPYGSHGQYRYIVRCERDESGAAEESWEDEDETDEAFTEAYAGGSYNGDDEDADELLAESSRDAIRKETRIRRACAGIMAGMLFLTIWSSLADSRKKKGAEE